LTRRGNSFAERGYERSTIRDIGEQAGLDSTLIARYFGSKAALYLEAMRTEFAAHEPGGLRDLLAPDRMTELVEQVGRRGPGPIFDIALQRLLHLTLYNLACTMIAERVVDPLDRGRWSVGEIGGHRFDDRALPVDDVRVGDRLALLVKKGWHRPTPKNSSS
jgi:AcrR family transcriptional regulator